MNTIKKKQLGLLLKKVITQFLRNNKDADQVATVELRVTKIEVLESLQKTTLQDTSQKNTFFKFPTLFS